MLNFTLYPDQIVVLLGLRSEMLTKGDPPRILLGKQTDVLMIAKLELAQGQCPVEIQDPVTGQWLNPNLYMTPDLVDFLRVNYLSDFPELEAAVDDLFIQGQ